MMLGATYLGGTYLGGTTGNFLPLSPSVATSSTSLAFNPYWGSNAVSSASLALTAPTRVPVASSVSTSSDSLAAPTVTQKIFCFPSQSTSTASAVPTGTMQVSLGASASTSTDSLALGAVLHPAVLQTYIPAPGYSMSTLKGASTSYAGSMDSSSVGYFFDIYGALSAGGGQFTVCDNGLKLACDHHPAVVRQQ